MSGNKRFEGKSEIDRKDLLSKEILDVISYSVIDSINGELLGIVAMREVYSDRLVEEEVIQASNRAFELLCDEVRDLMGIEIEEMGEALQIEAKDMMREAVYKIINENNQLAKNLSREFIIDVLEKHRDDLILNNPGQKEEIEVMYEGQVKSLSEIPDEDLKFDNFHQAMHSQYPVVKEIFQVVMHREGSVSKFIQERKKQQEKRLEHIVDVNKHRGKLTAEKSFMYRLGKFFGDLAKRFESYFTVKSKEEMLNIKKLHLLRHNVSGKKYDDIDYFKDFTAAEALQAASMFALKDKMSAQIHDIKAIRDAVLHPKHVDRIVNKLGGDEKIRQKSNRSR